LARQGLRRRSPTPFLQPAARASAQRHFQLVEPPAAIFKIFKQAQRDF
jgi:hypothetical protein